MTATPTVEAASRTHIGLVRRRNEDALYLGQWLYVVADGLGGHVAGDVASATAVEAMKAYDRPVQPDDLADALGMAINDANEAVRRRIREDPKLDGMGTTVVAMLRSGDTAIVANVGDSRAYLVRDVGSRDDTLVRISEDHTYEHLVSDARDVPGLHGKLVRWLDGRKDGRSPDLTRLRLRPGNRVLLCSDGLSSYVPEEEMRDALTYDGNPEDVTSRLVALALDHGGRDNVTVVVIDIARAPEVHSVASRLHTGRND